jgi:RecB family exonuclease
MSDIEQLDERRGVPSASGMDRLHNCPASFEMERHAPPEEHREDAASGTRIHAVLAGLAAPDTLSAAELETHDMCAAQAEQVVNEWAQPSEYDIEMLYEQRIGITQLGTALDVTPKSPASFRFTGQADMVILDGDRALVIDYKTGRGDTPVAQENPQLAALAVLVYLRYRVTSVRVAIVQPWAGKPTVSDYSESALQLAHSWLIVSLNAAETSTPDDARAGDHCKWCKAKAICDTFKNAAIQEVEAIETATIAGLDGETQRKAMWARALDLPAARLAAAVNGLAMVKRYVATIEGVAKARAENDPEFQQFFTLREKKGKRSIMDVTKVFNACAVHGVTADDFTNHCSIGLGDVKELLRNATKVKGKALDKLHDEVLTGAVETGKGSVELVPAGQLE